MDMIGIKIRSTCQQVRMLAKREQNDNDKSPRVSHNFYDKWARRTNKEMECDSDSSVTVSGNSPLPTRFTKRLSGVRKAVVCAIPPETYLRPKSKSRRIIYRPESCQFITNSDLTIHDNLRTSKTSLGFLSSANSPLTINYSKDGRRHVLLEDIGNIRRGRAALKCDQCTPLPIRNAVLEFTEGIVMRGDKYVFIDQLHKKTKSTPKHPFAAENIEGSDRPVARAQLIDFSEIKHILTLRRERLERDRLESLRKSHYTSFCVPVRSPIKIPKG